MGCGSSKPAAKQSLHTNGRQPDTVSAQESTAEPLPDARPRLPSGYVRPSAAKTGPQLKPITSGFSWQSTPSFGHGYEEDPQVMDTLNKWGYVAVPVGQGENK